jgi:hypothetical protein
MPGFATHILGKKQSAPPSLAGNDGALHGPDAESGR